MLEKKEEKTAIKENLNFSEKKDSIIKNGFSTLYIIAQRLVLKSNSDLEAYLRRKEYSLNDKKVSFKVPQDQNKDKSYKEENKTPISA